MGKIVVASQDIAIVASHLWTESLDPSEHSQIWLRKGIGYLYEIVDSSMYLFTKQFQQSDLPVLSAKSLLA